jgi:hypothetical protein
MSDLEPEICNCAALLQAARRAKVVVAKALPRRAQRRFESTFGTEAALELRTVLKEIAAAQFG